MFVNYFIFSLRRFEDTNAQMMYKFFSKEYKDFMNQATFIGISYTIGWFLCLLAGSNNLPLLAFLGAFSLIVIQLYYIYKVYPTDFKPDLILILLSIPTGIALEIFIVKTGILKYHDHNSLFPPIWIIMLYPQFALFLNHCIGFVKRNKFLPFLFGFIGAPPSYIGGASLGAATLFYPHWLIWLILGASWGVYLFLLTELAKYLDNCFKPQ